MGRVINALALWGGVLYSSEMNIKPGFRNGRLAVKERYRTKAGQSGWLCVCACGTEWVVSSSNLPRTKSCGCYHKDVVGNMTRTHGESKTRLYNIWMQMRQRCRNPHKPDYSYYGGRGIIVCDEWRTSYEAFRDWSYANGYKSDLTIDRKDNNRGYTPDNCRWATRAQQGANTRKIRKVLLGDEWVSVREAGRRLDINPDVIYWRLRRGDAPEEACAGLPGV